MLFFKIIIESFCDCQIQSNVATIFTLEYRSTIVTLWYHEEEATNKAARKTKNSAQDADETEAVRDVANLQANTLPTVKENR